MFDWNDLRHFLAVAREGSTLAAAKFLGVNQSTVHRHLAKLEEHLGRQIVVRHATGYRLTELGTELRPYVETVEEAVAALERRLSSLNKELTGTIRVTCATTIAHRLIGALLLDRFHTRHPGLRIELVMSDRLLDLSKGEADIAIRAGVPGDQTLFGRKIADVPWAIYASRSYVAQHGHPSRPEDMNQHAVVGFAGEVADHQAARWLRSAASQAAMSAHGNDIPSILLAVKSGAGLAPLPAPLASDEGLMRVLGPIPELRSQIYLLTHSDLKRSPRVRAFFDFVTAEIQLFRMALSGDNERHPIEADSLVVDSLLGRSGVEPVSMPRGAIGLRAETPDTPASSIEKT
jgi:DNA-binding transcriptional LysR family regulator